MSKTISKNEILAQLLAKRKSKSMDIGSDASLTGITPFQHSILLAALSDPTHKVYLIQMLMKPVRETSFTEMASLLVKLFTSSPGLRLFVQETSEGFELKECQFESEWIVNKNFQSTLEIQQEADSESISVLGERLFKIIFYMCDGKVHYVRMVFHHLLIDGTGIKILEGRINSLLQGRELPIDLGYLEFAQRCIRESTSWRQRAQLLVKKFHGADFTKISLSGDGFVHQPNSIELDLKRISSFCQDQQITRAGFLYAALALVLSSISRNSLITLGTVTENRGISDEDALGCYINTAVLTYNFTGTENFASLLEVAHKSILEMLNDSDVPYIYLREELQKVGWSKDQLFQAFVNYIGETTELNILPIATRNTKFDFNFLFTELNGKLVLSFDGKLVPGSEWLNAFFTTFQRIIALCMNHSEIRLDDVHLFFRPSILLVEESSQSKHLVHFFDEAVALTPKKPFILSTILSLSYQETLVYAEKVASVLLDAGLPVGGRVGIILDRSPYFIPTCIGIWKAGGSYVPVDVRQNAGRKSDILRSASLSYTIALNVDEELPKSNWDLDFLISYSNIRKVFPKINVSAEAYVLFTSGSTGLPKGVSVSHSNIYHYAVSLGNYLGANELRDLSYGVVSTPAADLGNTSIFLALVYGGSLFQFRYEEVIEPVLFQAIMAKYMVNILKIVPSHFQGLCSDTNYMSVPDKILIFGGEKLSYELVRKIKGVHPELRICNHYGPTETTVGIFCNELTKEMPASGHVPLGKPFGKTQVATVDHLNRFIDQIFTGELIVYGPSVTKGYINGASSAFGHDEHGDYYRTGDIVHSNKGDYTYLGREDEQLKINGVRVDVSELELALSSVLGLKNFTVIYHRSSFHVIHVDSLAFTEDKAKLQLGSEINSHLLPATFIKTDNLPVGLNGKIDKTKLIELVDEAQTGKNDLNLNSIHPAIKEVWTQILGEPRSANETIFQQGGSSLLAARVLSRLNKELIKTVSLGVFLKNPSLVHLNSLYTTGAGNKTEIRISVSQKELSSFQQRMWFINQMDPLSSAYNVPLYLHFGNEVSPSHLKGFLKGIFAHFLVLQTVFKETNGVPEIGFDSSFDQVFVELTDTEVENQYQSLLSKGIDLLNERPFRIYFGTNRLFVYFHHIITDGLSNRFFLSLLDGFLNKDEQKFTHFPRHLSANGNTIQPDVETFWKAQLQGFGALDFSYQKMTSTANPIFKEFTLSNELSVSVGEWCQKHSVFPKDYFLGLFTLALGFVFNQSKFYQLTVINTRSNEDEYNTLGPSLDTMLFGIDIYPNESLESFIKRIKDTFWDFHQHSSLSFGEQLQIKKLLDRAGKLIPNYMFAYEKGVTDFKNFSIVHTPAIESKFPLSISVFEHPNCYRVELSSTEKEVGLETMERILKVFSNLIDSSLHDVDTIISNMPFGKDLRVCTYDGRHSPITTLLDAFRSQVKVRGSHTCVREESYALTFAEIDFASTNLAQKIVVEWGTDKLIGLHLAPSVNLIVALLGILKSGNAFTPIDLSTPTARLNQVLSAVDQMIDQITFDRLSHLEQASASLPEISPYHVAYCIFTSGSTGLPKAVPISHAAIGNYLTWAHEEFIGDNEGAIPLISSLNYDLTVTSYLLPLFSGRPCHIFNENNILSTLDKFSKTSASYSMVKMTPSHLQVIKDQLINSKMKIKSLVLGGEGLDVGLLSNLINVENLVNEYGPAETTIGVTTHMFAPTQGRTGPCPLGAPVPNTTIYLNGFLGQPVLPFTKGRLMIQGIQVFEGYRGTGQKTLGIYDSGDLAYEAFGEIYYLGRDDGQIKIAGNRVELSEIELLLRKYFSLKDFSLEHIERQGQKYLVCIHDLPISAEEFELRKKVFLGNVSSYMLPDYFFHKSQIHIIDSGKTDWASTLDQFRKTPPSGEEVSGHLEQVSKLWSEVLNLQSINIDTNFFDAGGTSLSLIRLLNGIKQLTKRELSIVDLLRLTTIKQQASLFSDQSEKIEAVSNRSRSRIDMRKRN